MNNPIIDSKLATTNVMQIVLSLHDIPDDRQVEIEQELEKWFERLNNSLVTVYGGAKVCTVTSTTLPK